MKFSILSHACLLVETEHHSIVIDPWLVGSCYWRSWWNFPQAEFDETCLAKVDAVVISHIHWDHWHGPTLKKFFRGKPVYVPDEPGSRSERDLRSIGFDDVRRIPHASSFEVGDIKVTLYQFGLFLNDAAIVVEAAGCTLLNANDAKIAGMALRQLVAQHGRFDFAFRSHSSANPRVCYRLEGQADFSLDDRDHYFRSFAGFMDVVNPHHAIPFASNHCHLQDDVLRFNQYISNPLELRQYIERTEGDHNWTLQVMLPGSSWSTEAGFRLRSEECFADVPGEIAAYRSLVAARLEHYRRQENAVEISDALIERFIRLLDVKPLSGAVRKPFVVSLFWPDGRGRSIRFDLSEGRAEQIPYEKGSQDGVPLLTFPAVVFRDAVVKNMFHHAAISKRCSFVARSVVDLKRVQRIMSVLEKVELGALPWSWSYVGRLTKSYARRWRELFVYAHALWWLFVRRRPVFIAEEMVLRGKL